MGLQVAGRRGELHNLRIERGTLCEEERYIINHHIVQTIIMLSQLPFSPHLRGVPEIAGGHHEKMDGTGYPKWLKREEMSDTPRMMAIADIYEALTASDRPYKKAKNLFESLRIMQKMKAHQYIDPGLYELLIDSVVWRVYAQRFLQPAHRRRGRIAVSLAAFDGVRDCTRLGHALYGHAPEVTAALDGPSLA